MKGNTSIAPNNEMAKGFLAFRHVVIYYEGTTAR
jgi:hypothetical protein